MSAPKVDVHGILERAGANPDAPEGSQAWALAQVDAAVAKLIEQTAAAEQFIAGFEGDEIQEGIGDLLATLRAALANIGGAA
jgi:hypothetical protein